VTRTLPQLQKEAAKRSEELDRARTAYRRAARRCLIAHLLAVLRDTPAIRAVGLSVNYEYDDEGGYFRCLSGSLTLAAYTKFDEEFDDVWTEGLDVEHEVILDLFAIDDVGEGALTRVQIHALAAAEGLAGPATPAAREGGR